MTGAFVDLRGVRTWYDEAGEGPPLVMLHPGGVDSRAFGPNVGALAGHFHVWLPERRGHGRTPDTDAPYGYDTSAEDTIQFLEQLVGGRAWLPGVLVPPHAGASAFEQKLHAMHIAGPRLNSTELEAIHCRTLVMAGDDDEMALEHTLELYRSLPNGELAIVPGTSHGFLVEKPDICNALLLEFLTRDPVPTFAPIRRA